MQSLLIKAVDKWPMLFLPLRSRRFSKMVGRHYSFRDFTQKGDLVEMKHFSWFDLCSFDVTFGDAGNLVILSIGPRSKAKTVGASFNLCRFNDYASKGNIRVKYKQDEEGSFKICAIAKEDQDK